MRQCSGIKGRCNRRQGAAAVMAAMLCVVLAACGQGASATPRAASTATSAPSPTATPRPTATPTLAIPPGSPPIAGHVAAWRHANLPAGYGMQFDAADLRIAASAGTTAYSCGRGSAGHTPVIVTHDRGASWVRVADAPVGGSGCQSIFVDALNPAIVVCCQYTSGPQAISTDGGASWYPSASSYVVLQLATVGSRTYAVLGQNVPSGQVETLGASDDGLRTWRIIDGPFDAPDYATNLGQLWVNPVSGALLLGGIFSPLWSSADGGQHWSQVPLPANGMTTIAVQQPTAAQPWHICGSYFGTPEGTSTVIACTRDGGMTWAAEPPIAPGDTVALRELVGMPADGSLLAASYSRVYRLPAGATRWQDLGATPTDSNGGVVYAASSAGGGSLWTFPTESDGAGGADPATAVYSAAYPY